MAQPERTYSAVGRTSDRRSSALSPVSASAHTSQPYISSIATRMAWRNTAEVREYFAEVVRDLSRDQFIEEIGR